MQLCSFRVTKFRNIIDSGDVIVDPSVTCLVGKNEAGKSGLLEALYLFNPAHEEEFSVEDQYPRWLMVQDRKKGDLEKHTPIQVTFTVEDRDKKAVENVLGVGVFKSEQLKISRKYDGGTTWNFEWDQSKAIQNLLEIMPTEAQSVLSKATTLKELREIIEEDDGEDEEISTALEVVEEKLKELRLENTGIWQRIVNILRIRLPCFFRFTQYSTLPGRIDFEEIASDDETEPAKSDLQTARALLKLAGTDLDQLGNDDYELRRGELEAVGIDLTNQVFEYWKQNPHLEVNIDVDKENVQLGNGTKAVSRYLDIRLKDKRTGYSNNFSQRSSGFQWFFSFLAAFSEFDDKASPIVLLDEPALTLHGKAQADFLRFINERLSPSAPVIYTTHSPFMVEADGLERVRIVEDQGPPAGSVVSDGVFSKDPDSIFPLQAALGYDIAQNLFVGPHNLVVEGTSDYIYLTVMSRLCKEVGRDSLDDKWRVLPAGGATNIPTFVSLIGPNLDVTVLADSDTKGMQRVTNMIEKKLLASNRLIMASAVIEGQHADIEDLFSEGDYLKLYNKTFAKTIKVSDLPKGDRIVKRIESYIGEKYDHGEVAETLLRHHQDLSLTETSIDRFEAIIKGINKTLSV